MEQNDYMNEWMNPYQFQLYICVCVCVICVISVLTVITQCYSLLCYFSYEDIWSDLYPLWGHRLGASKGLTAHKMMEDCKEIFAQDPLEIISIHNWLKLGMINILWAVSNITEEMSSFQSLYVLIFVCLDRETEGECVLYKYTKAAFNLVPYMMKACIFFFSASVLCMVENWSILNFYLFISFSVCRCMSKA